MLRGNIGLVVLARQAEALFHNRDHKRRERELGILGLLLIRLRTADFLKLLQDVIVRDLEVAQGLGGNASCSLASASSRCSVPTLVVLRDLASSFASDMTLRARSVNRSNMRVPLTCYLRRISFGLYPLRFTIIPDSSSIVEVTHTDATRFVTKPQDQRGGEPICASTVPFGAAQHDAKRINASGSPWAYRRRDDEVGRDVLFCCNWNTSPTENPRYAARRLSTSTSNV